MEKTMSTSVQEKTETVNSNRLAGKVALVTGGSRGIGAAIAQRLAQEGATVLITYSKNKKAADEVITEITKQGKTAHAFKADVACEKETSALIEEVTKATGKIDILINNAGVWGAGPIDAITLEAYHKVFDVNVKGVIATTIAALKLIPEGGRIINLSSVAGRIAMPGVSIYSASKAALDHLTKIWAQELGPKGITVNAVAPGTTVTDMFNEAIGEEQHAGVIEKTALRRLGQAEDIAAVVAFLASKDGGWVTGQTITADGGLNM